MFPAFVSGILEVDIEEGLDLPFVLRIRLHKMTFEDFYFHKLKSADQKNHDQLVLMVNCMTMMTNFVFFVFQNRIFSNNDQHRVGDFQVPKWQKSGRIVSTKYYDMDNIIWFLGRCKTKNSHCARI